MKQTIYAPNTVPTANIAVNKSRLKVYNNAGSLPTYYLQKGQEFQIELFNPTTDVVLAKISLNGKAISQGGLVLNPGQRIYLDRYLDVAKKFLFDTYEVGQSAEVMAAIKDNGDFKVEFFKEQKPLPPIDFTYRPHIINNGINRYNSSPSINDLLRGSNTGGYSGDVTFTTSSIGGNSTLTLNSLNGNISSSTAQYNSAQSNASYTNNIPTLDGMDSGLSQKKSRSLAPSALRSKSIETGRVEMGSDSNQQLKTVSKSFEYFAFHTTTYKMLPLSQKINTVEDINVKRYCTQCGAKVGKTDNFCASCGKKA